MRLIYGLIGLIVNAPAFGDIVSLGPLGIDSLSTGLTGQSVLIGQADLGRSGKFGYDNPANSAEGTVPAAVYNGLSGGQDIANSMNISIHGTVVAGILVSSDAAYGGVAPQAQLHSLSIGEGSATSDQLALYLNRLATLGSGLVAATNMSFVHELQFPEASNGQSHLTSFVDWSARQHNLLYVASWGNGNHDYERSPADNYNGITVASSGLRENESSWRNYAASNSSHGLDFDDSLQIDILAPGEAIDVLAQGHTLVQIQGTSIAAPHVTGAVALLQQFATNTFPGNSNSRRHEVMKAVMMNSADKVDGVQGSNRTVCNNTIGTTCFDWRQSEAYIDTSIPLDDQMGAGHLNVRRSVQQLGAGEHGPGTVPSLGWDLGSYGAGSLVAEYILSGSASGYMTVTLAWDRIVESTGFTNYSSGDQFFGWSLADLNVEIQTLDGVFIAGSLSPDSNVEHIFFQTSGADQYKIVVTRSGFAGPLSGSYALAWWIGNGSSQPGDYNKNGSVGPEDYDVWKANFGTSFADADGNGNGVVDAGDYTVWRDNFGAGSGGGSLASVPEPASVGLMLAAMAGVVGRRRLLRLATH